MSHSRINLHNILLKIMGDDGPVYYQKPPDKDMKIPCIVYEKSNYNSKYANNKIYIKKTHYTVTYLCTRPDNEDVTDKILALPYCSFDRRFMSNNIYHDVFDLYYEDNTIKEEKK